MSKRALPTIHDLIPILEREIVEGWWINGLDLRHEGGHGDPTWRIYHDGGSLTVEYELGRYGQSAVADTLPMLLGLMRGMEAANKALNACLTEAAREERR